jgi:predicted amidohydrolase
MNDLLRIAAAQFPVSPDLLRNARYIQRQMEEAAQKGAHVIQFPEAALPGYAPTHHSSLAEFPWDDLEAQTRIICELASVLHLWVILGSMRYIETQAPRNCVQIISSKGQLEGVYDKQRLYGREKKFFSVGAEPCIVEINGFKCGFLICYDNCYPELYDAYRRSGVGLIFHSFHNAGNERATSIKDLMLANLIVRAADNRMWICASNSSKRYSPLSACIVRPDGSMVRCRRNLAGLVLDDYPRAHLDWTYDNRQP